MKALVIVAHGSRRQESNQEIQLLAKNLSDKGVTGFSLIQYGFLELAEPSIPEAIIQCIKNGAAEVTVLPYFLSAGRHVVTDIPEEVAKAQQVYPDTPIHITPYLGAAEELLSVMARLAEA